MSTPARLPEGTLIDGRYKITGYLGEGGFATVYRGLDVEIERPVAIKILTLLGHTVDPEMRKSVLARFRREATTAARIRHPNAVTIFDVGMTADEHPFIIMELLRGRPLDEELEQRGPMHPHRIVRLFTRCLEALGEAHRLGIVHKDLKPSNLFLIDPDTDHESLAILDFGIAGIAQGEDARLTGTGQILGTPRYMAPEYIQEQTIAPALDVYQMGLILAEMFTGRPVVDKNTMVGCIMIHTQGIVIPAALRGTPLEAIVARAVSHDAAARFPDADAFRKALEAIPLEALGEPEPTPEKLLRPETPTKPQKPSEDEVADTIGPTPTPEHQVVATFEEPPQRPERDKGATIPEVKPPATGGKPPIGALVLGALLVLGVIGGVIAVVGGGGDKPDATEGQEAERDKEQPAIGASEADGDAPEAPADARGHKKKADSDDTHTEERREGAAQAQPDRGQDDNPWIRVEPPDEPLTLGVDPAATGLPKRLQDKLNAFHTGVGLLTPEAPYDLQQREVTWGQLDPWLAQDAHKAHRFALPAGVSEDPQARAALPATGMPWATADAYCRSLGGALPTEAQWEYAARGPELRRFPWGDEPARPEALAAFKGKEAALVPAARDATDRTPGPRPIHDLMGNAQEWTGDDWRANLPGGDASWASAGPSIYRPIRGFPLDKPMESLDIHMAEGAAYRMSLCAAGPCLEEYPEAQRFVGFRCARPVPNP